jgi:protoporphyrinogen oxidase
MEQKIKKVLVIGAGYAVLACSYELVKHNIDVVLVEKTNSIGGLSSTVTLKNIKFELGPHIYFNKDKVVNQLWKELIGDKLKSYKRNNKIFYKGKFIDSPLNIFNVISKIGVLRSISYLISFMWYKFLKFNKSPNNSKEWVIFNFGKKLYDNFLWFSTKKFGGLNVKKYLLIGPDKELSLLYIK